MTVPFTEIRKVWECDGMGIIGEILKSSLLVM